MSNYWKRKLEELNKESSTSDDYWERKLAELEEEEKKKKKEDDIAPVRTTTKKEDDEGFDFFQKGAFEDGYQAFDVTKTILGTVADAGVGIVKGASKLVGGIVDAGMYGVAGVADMVGADEFADDVRVKAKENTIDNAFRGVDDYLNQYSVLGRTSDAVAEGIGQVASIILTGGAAGAAGLGVVGTTAATTGLMGVSSIGSGMSEAYAGGATDEEAATYGLISGVVNAGSELIFGGLGKTVKALGISKGLSSLDDMFAQKLSSKIANQTAKNFVEFGVKASAEGVEEVLAGIGTIAGKKLTYMSEEELSKLIKDENLLEQFVVGAVTSGISQSGLVPGMKSGSLAESNQTGRDFISGLSENEQKVVDKVYQDLIAEREKDGKKLTNKEKNDLYDRVLDDMEKGRITTDTIEEVLGGDTYKSYRDASKSYEDTVNSEEALKQELLELRQMESGKMNDIQRDRLAELKGMNLDDATKRDGLKQQMTDIQDRLSGEVSELVKGDRLIESYNDKARRFEDFVADFDKYKGSKHEDAARKTLESAVKAGANNTIRVHDLVDLAAQTSADTGISFDFQSGEQIKTNFIERQAKKIAEIEKIPEAQRTAEQSKNLEVMKELLAKVQSGETIVNGNITENGIVLNLDSAKPLNRVVGHELTHSFESGKNYKELHDALMSYAKTKGVDVESKLAEYKAMYEGDTTADPEAEMIADMVGDFLFDDGDFAKNLSVQNRNVFQKIWDEIKYLCRVAKAGSQEARDLERVKKAFEDAYRAEKNTAKDGGAKYDLMDVGGTFMPVIDTKNDTRNYKAAEKYLQTLVDTENPFATILYDTQPVYIGNDLPSEYKGSEYTVGMNSALRKVKMQAATNLDEMLLLASNGEWVENKKEKHKKDAKNGWYRYDTEFAVPVMQYKNLDHYTVYSATLLIRNDADGKSYLYDMIDVKEKKKVFNSPTSGEAVFESRPSSEKIVPQSDGVVKNSLSDSDGRQISKEQQDVKVMEGGSVAKYSLSTWTPETQSKVRANLIKAGYDGDQVDKWIKDTNSVASVIAADKDRLDFEAADNQTMLKNNQEYVKTLDASTLCAKRLLYQGTFDAIQHRMPNTMLSSDDLISLLNIMKAHGVQTPCGVCYVESRRRHLGKFAQEWLDGYKGEYKPNLDEVTTSDGLEALRKSHPVAYEDFMTAMKKKGSANPKVVQLRTKYRNEIMSLTPAQIRKIESIGGLRVQSFSDFETPHLLDMMQAVMDMSAKGLTSQAYTKVPNFAWVFGNTGIKINLSLIADGDGFDADGNLAFSSVEGMDFDEAMRLRNAYSENVGTIIVGANDKHILACMADDRIDFIIPFHRSGWGQNELDMMGMSSYTDYTYGQKEHDLKTGKGVENLYPPDYWDYNLSGKENAERYLNLCAKTGREPKFSHFLVNNGDGSYRLQPDGSTDGYWKTLIDFKMYDNDGIGVAQQKVQPNFNMEEAYRVLTEYEGGANKLPVANDVVDEFVAKHQSGTLHSLSDDSAPFTPSTSFDIYGKDMVKQSAPVEEVAPVRDTATIAENATVADDATAMFPDDLAPIADNPERFDSLTDADAPPERAVNNQTDTISPDDPLYDRDIGEVGKRNVKAYMYENPEVKPFFQEEALGMLGDLQGSIKGERWFNEGDFDGYGAESNYRFGGTKRHTTDDIAELLDVYGYSYAEIEKGLNAIIEDHGAENNAVSKRIEFMLNDRLMYGYKDVDGRPYPPNQDYINLLNEKQINEYSKEAFDAFMANADQYAPPISEGIAEDIAPVVTERVVRDTASISAPYEAIRPKREKQPKVVRATEEEPRMLRADSGNVRPGEKQRKWIGTSTESEAVDGKILPKDLDQDVIHYRPISNKVTLGKANSRLDGMGFESSVAYFNSQFANKSVSLEDVALGERLIQEAIKRGDTKTAGELIQNVAILGTELGQKVQALSIIKRLTPEGQLGMLQKTVERGKTKGDKAFDGVEFTQEMIDKILSAYNPDGTYDQMVLNEVVEDVKQKIADQMKVTKLDKVNAWRYLSMLGNPKTHIRNLVSNVAMRGTMGVKNAVARSIESVAPISNRTKTWQAASQEVKNYASKAAEDMKDIISGENRYSESAGIKQKRRIFQNKILNGLYEFNSDMLGKEDWWFSKSAFTSSLSEFLTANGIRTEQDIKRNPEIVEKARQYAVEQSQIATFRQYSWLANKINEIERKNVATDIAVGSIVPFKKTPINIAKTGLSYSPLGFAKTLTYDVSQVKNGKMEASEMIDHLAQNVTGSALALVGYMLAQSGLLNGAGEDDKEGEYDYQLGEQAYSVNIGGATFSLSWLSPVAMPLFVGANAYEQLVEGKEWNGDVVVETLAQTLDPLSEMSFISSLDSVLSSYDSGIQKFAGIGETMAQNYITQFAPTLMSQVATVMDDTKRSTKVAGDSDFKFVEQTINKLKYKIPFLRETLEPTTDIWGNEVKQTENIMARAFETFLAPYAKRENTASEVDEEIKRLYGETGDTGLIPSIPYNYANYDGEKYKMSAGDYTEFKKNYGQIAFDYMEKLFSTNTYQAADSETRAEYINKVYDYARDEARKEYFSKFGVEFTNATEDGVEYYKPNAIKGAIENDVTPEEYTFSVEYPEKYAVAKSVGGYEAYKGYSSELYDIKADKDSSGKSISGSRKEKVVNYINNLDLDYGAKIILFKSEYNADDTYNYDIIEYLNSRNDISYKEMETILKELGFTVDSKGNISW